MWALIASHTNDRNLNTENQNPASVWLLTEWSVSCSSSSLDALNADSEGEGHSQPPICYAVGSQSSSRTGFPSGDELESFETSTEADCNISRTESLSLSSTLHSKVFSSVFVQLIVNAQNMFSMPPPPPTGQVLSSSHRRNTCVCVERDFGDLCFFNLRDSILTSTTLPAVGWCYWLTGIISHFYILGKCYYFS